MSWTSTVSSPRWPWMRSPLSTIRIWYATASSVGVRLSATVFGIRVINSTMSEQQERTYIQQAIDTLKRTTGTTPLGWLGPEYGESARTPQLLAQAGIRYVCDCVNDEQPYALKTAQGALYALPIMLELDDIHALWERRVPIDRYSALLKESFDILYRDGKQNGRLLVLHLHPWNIGQPFRIGFLDEALGYMMRHQGVWATNGAQIIDWYQSHVPTPP